jgi:transcriptional regulator with XRE-family HTH domain
MNKVTTKPKKPRTKNADERDLPNRLTKKLGSNLKRYRIEADISQMELAFRAELERSHVSRIERGVTNPSLFALATICHVLKITLPQLFEDITATIAPTLEGGPYRRKNQSILDKAPETGIRRSKLR